MSVINCSRIASGTRCSSSLLFVTVIDTWAGPLPDLGHAMPWPFGRHGVQNPNDKTNLAPYRVLHRGLLSRASPKDWAGLQWPDLPPRHQVRPAIARGVLLGRLPRRHRTPGSRRGLQQHLDARSAPSVPCADDRARLLPSAVEEVDKAPAKAPTEPGSGGVNSSRLVNPAPRTMSSTWSATRLRCCREQVAIDHNEFADCRPRSIR